MRQKMTWKYYSSRRGLTLESLHDKQGFNSYEELTSYLSNLWVLPPEKSSEEWIAIEQKITSSRKNAFIEKVKKTGLHPDGRKLKKGEDPESIWEFWETAVAGSYEAQPPARVEQEQPKKESSTRKTTTRKTTTRKTTTRKAKTSTRKTAAKKGD